MSEIQGPRPQGIDAHGEPYYICTPDFPDKFARLHNGERIDRPDDPNNGWYRCKNCGLECIDNFSAFLETL